MLKKASSRKKKWILAPIAGVLTAAVIAGTVYDASEKSAARVSLPGIEKINQSNGHSDPFTILEIVPSYKNARVGYFVKGEEPAYYDDEHGVLALADMGSYDERNERYPKSTGDFANSAHDFIAFSELHTGPFDFAQFEEDNLFLDPEAASRAKEFSTYGSFVEKKDASATADYQDARNGTSAFLKVVAPDATAPTDPLDPNYLDSNYPDEYKMKNIILTNHDATTGAIYDDEVEYFFEAGTDKALFFSPVEDATKVVDSNASFPYQLDADYTKNPQGPYNWSYYVANPVIFTETYDENDPTILTGIEVSIPTDEVLPIYVDKDGADTDGYYRSPEYLGYVYNDSTDGWCFKSIGNNTTTYTNLLDPTNLTEYETLIANYATLYDPATYPNAVYYAMSTYSSWDSDTLPDNLYYASAMDDNTLSPGEGFVSDPVVTKKVMRLMKGQDPTQYGFSVDDQLTYHTFYYLKNTPDAEYQYYKRASIKRDDATHNFVSDYTGDINETFTYDGGFDNKEWFKKYVLDRDDVECDSSVVDVVTKLSKDVTVDDIANADLIYISGYAYTNTEDLSKDVAQAVLQSVKDNKAIVIDAADIIDFNADITSNKITNVKGEQIVKLSVALLQPAIEDADIDTIISKWDDANFFGTTFGDKRQNKPNGYTKRSVFLTPSSSTTPVVFSKKFITTLSNGASDYKEVDQSIQDEKFLLKNAYGEEGYKSLRFNEEISYATIIRHILSYGERRLSTKDTYRVLDLEPFYSDIVENNKNNTGVLGTTFRDKDGTYTDGNFYSRSRDNFDSAWFMKNMTNQNNPPKLEVTGMGTREFVGKINDLNTDYDLIYIGLDTLYMNTKRESKDSSNKGTTTVYNDEGLEGKVYTHIGDYFNINLQKGDGGANYTNNIPGGNHTPDIMINYQNDNYHTSGNDITFEKLRDLTTYVEAGYAVLLSDNFFTYGGDGKINGINKSKVDEHSYMYDFIKFCLYGNKYRDANGEIKQVDIDSAMRSKDYSHGYMGINVNVKRTFENNNSRDYVKSTKTASEQKKDFVDHMNIGKLQIDLLSKPTEYYEGGKEGNYLASNKGKYTLDYDVMLTNIADVGSPSYDCKLYLDIDADGRYADNEVQRITSITSGDAAYSMEDGKYHLSTDRTYHISLDVPEGFKGFLSWKLEFVENDRASVSGNDVVKAAETGYSAVPENDTKETIKILQIVSGDGKGNNENNLDLTDANMQSLYKEVKDFNISVTKVNADDFVNNQDDWPNDQKLNLLMEYNMIVMGFADAYVLRADNEVNVCNAVYAIREYVLSGRSVLFTHDLTNSSVEFNSDIVRRGQSNDEKNIHKGAYIDEYLRDVQGMDRYGATQYNLARLEQITGKKCSPYNSRYDDDLFNDLWGQQTVKSTDGRGNLRYDNKGLVQSLFLKYHFNGGQPNGLGDLGFEKLNGLIQSQNTWGRTGTIKNDPDNFVTEKITQVNRGQITDYPFHIAEEIPVSMTHSQYFQLNLDTDSKDANTNDDIVVWYALSGDTKNGMYYGINRNDVRNNYYIFNKGNITYTGSGHSIIGENQKEERKLFVNTLVAAYTVGNHAPTISFKESPWNQSATISAKYEPYDIDLVNAAGKEGSTLGDKVTVHFKVVNNNLKNNVEIDEESEELIYKYKDIHVKYYIEDAGGDVKINTAEGKPITLREIDPSKITLKKVVDNAGNAINKPQPIGDNAGKLLLENYAIYTADIDNSVLLNTVADSEDSDKLNLNKHSIKLYIRASMDEISNDKDIPILPSTESLSDLDINFTELYELK